MGIPFSFLYNIEWQDYPLILTVQYRMTQPSDCVRTESLFIGPLYFSHSNYIKIKEETKIKKAFKRQFASLQIRAYN